MGCLCGAERDTVFSALNRGRLLLTAYKDLKLRYDSSGVLVRNQADSLTRLDTKYVKQGKKLRRVENGRSGWRTVAIVLAAIAALSLL